MRPDHIPPRRPVYHQIATAAGVWLVAYGEPADPVALERAYADAKLVQPRGEAR